MGEKVVCNERSAQIVLRLVVVCTDARLSRFLLVCCVHFTHSFEVRLIITSAFTRTQEEISKKFRKYFAVGTAWISTFSPNSAVLCTAAVPQGKEKVCLKIRRRCRGERRRYRWRARGCRPRMDTTWRYFHGVRSTAPTSLDLVLLRRAILVQVPHDEQLDREQNSHGVQVVNRVGRAGVAGLDEQERTVAYRRGRW